jgi:hypothetical protein
VTLSTSTLSSGDQGLSSEISVSPGAATTNFCDGASSACYITADPVPTNSATCSGTSDPFATYVTETTTVGQYLTVSGNFSTPEPVYITPLPFCNETGIIQKRKNNRDFPILTITTSTVSSSTSSTPRYYGNSTSMSSTLNSNSTNPSTTQSISTQISSIFLTESFKFSPSASKSLTTQILSSTYPQ